jgi:hypothetical protein
MTKHNLEVAAGKEVVAHRWAPNEGRSGGRQIKKQKLPAEVSKADRKLSPERMRVALADAQLNVVLARSSGPDAGIGSHHDELGSRRSHE